MPLLQKLLISGLCFFCWISSSHAERMRVLAVDEPPASFINSQNRADGYVTDIALAMLAEAGDVTEIEVIPEARALNIASQQPNIILFTFSRTPFRENKYYWIGEVLKKEWKIYGLKEMAPKINSLQQLKDFTAIGVVRGDVREEWLLNKGFNNLHSLTKHKQNIQLLLLGRLPFIAYEDIGVQITCKELKETCNSITPVYTLRSSSGYILMSRNGTSEKMAKRYQNAFDRIKENGKLAELTLKWQQRLKLADIQVARTESNNILQF